MPESEAQVVRWLVEVVVGDSFLSTEVTPSRLVVDRDASYQDTEHDRFLSSFYGRPRIAGRRPDVLFAASRRMIAIEVKSSSRSYQRGLTQALEYRQGVHDSYLCVPGPEQKLPEGARFAARENGCGVLCVEERTLSVAVEPPSVTPDPEHLLSTQRYLSERYIERAFGLNHPLNYVAALMAVREEGQDPVGFMLSEWGLESEGSIRHAIRGAETLGLVAPTGLTHMGRAYAKCFEELGFGFDSHKTYSRRGRLVGVAPGISALLRSIYLQLEGVQLTVEVLTQEPDETVDLTRLALDATEEDEGTALALFGEAEPDELWRPIPTTVHQFKQALWHVGILKTKASKGAKNLNKYYPEVYRPGIDIWELDTEHV